MREICDKYDVLFVADEVLCGYGRCGLPFAIAAWGVEPDMITLGKAIASGYASLAALVVSVKIREGLAQGTGRFVHGLTYAGNPVSCFVGLKVHEIMRREQLFTRAADIGGYMKVGLEKIAARHAMVAAVPDRMIDTFAVAGTPTQVRDQLRRRPFIHPRAVAPFFQRDRIGCPKKGSLRPPKLFANRLE